jgi:hypothetical protein
MYPTMTAQGAEHTVGNGLNPCHQGAYSLVTGDRTISIRKCLQSTPEDGVIEDFPRGRQGAGGQGGDMNI